MHKHLRKNQSTWLILEDPCLKKDIDYTVTEMCPDWPHTFITVNGIVIFRGESSNSQRKQPTQKKKKKTQRTLLDFSQRSYAMLRPVHSELQRCDVPSVISLIKLLKFPSFLMLTFQINHWHFSVNVIIFVAFKNRFNSVLWCCLPTSKKRSQDQNGTFKRGVTSLLQVLMLTKTETLTVRLNEALHTRCD